MVFLKESQAKLWPQYLAALSVSCGAFAVGTVLGWSSPVQAKILSGEYGFSVSDDEFSWISALATLGSAVVCIPSGFLVNRFGRKLFLLALVVPYTIGYVMLIWAQNVAMMCVARFLLGMAAGAFCVAAPMYTAEIAQNEIRGTLGSYFQLLLVSGVLFSYLVGGPLSAQWCTVVMAVIPILFFIIFVFMPESPAYLVKKNKTEEAIKSLQWLRGDSYNYQSELDTLQAEEEAIKDNQISFSAAFSRRTTIKALIISLGLMFFQQLSGVNSVIFYGADIFRDAQTSIDDNLSTVIIGVMQVVFTFVSSLVVDKLGRRILLLASGSVMCLSTTALATYFYLKEIDSPVLPNITWLPVVSLCFFIILFSFGFGPVPWLIMPELFASDVRSIASSFAVTMNWICAFIVTKTFVNLKTAIGSYGAFWLFSGVSFLSVIFISFLVLETKGKSLQQIQLELEGKSSKNQTHLEPTSSYVAA